MYFIVKAMDKPDSHELRQATRPKHLDYIHGDKRVRLGGPFLDAEGRMIGSMVILEAADRAAAEAWAERVLGPLLEFDTEPGSLINVNFPALPPDEVKGIRVCRQGLRDYGRLHIVQRTDPRGYDYYWFGLGPMVQTPGHLTVGQSAILGRRNGCILMRLVLFIGIRGYITAFDMAVPRRLWTVNLKVLPDLQSLRGSPCAEHRLAPRVDASV